MTLRQSDYLLYVQEYYQQYEFINATKIINILNKTEIELNKAFINFTSHEITILMNNAFVEFTCSELDKVTLTLNIRTHTKRLSYYLSDFIHFLGLTASTRSLLNEVQAQCQQKGQEALMALVEDTKLKEIFIGKYAPIFDEPIPDIIKRNNLHFYTSEFIFHLAQWELFTGHTINEQPLQYITHFLKYLAWNMYSPSFTPTILSSHFDFLKAIECTHAYIKFLHDNNIVLDKGAKYLYDLEYPDKWNLYRDLVKGEAVTTYDIYAPTAKINYHQEYLQHLLDTDQHILHECSKRIITALVPKHTVWNRHSYYFTQQMLKNCIPIYRPQYYPSKQRFRMIAYSTPEVLIFYHNYGIINGYFPYLSIDTLITPDSTS